MKKEKKITVKFFLNKAIQPETDERQKRYPLYMVITYNRRNTMLKSLYGGYYKDLKEVEKENPGLMEFEEKTIQKIIRYEANKYKEYFDLKGVNKKYANYSRSIELIFSKYLKHHLWIASVRCEPKEYSLALNFNAERIEFDVLYSICKKIYSHSDLHKSLPNDFEEEIDVFHTFKKLYPSFFNYNFPTIIEWLNQSIIENYRTKLEKIYKKDKRMIEKSIAVVKKIIFSQVEA